MVDINEWRINIGNSFSDYLYIDIPPVSSNYIYHPIIQLIGDKTDRVITIPENNTDILKYTLGEGINGEFVEKQLQVNAPCEYNSYGTVSSRTWLTFNSYTASQ